MVASITLSAAMGANDVANAFGTSVGARVLTLRQALFVASIFEFTGAMALGAGVTSTIAGGVINLRSFEPYPALYMLGMFSALVGSVIWVALATVLKLPVSTTHAIVGSIVGFTIVQSSNDVNWWPGVGRICLSWVVSPIFSGIFASMLYLLTRYIVLRKPPHIAMARQGPFVACVVGFTCGLTTVFITFKATGDRNPWVYANVLMALGVALVTGGATHRWLAPLLFRHAASIPVAGTSPAYGAVAGVRTPEAVPSERPSVGDGDWPVNNADVQGRVKSASVASTVADGKEDTDEERARLIDHQPYVAVSERARQLHENAEEFDEGVERRFAAVQVLTAVFQSFAHGANDVSNAAGPLVGVWRTYEDGEVKTAAEVYYWILAIGGAAIVFGLAMWGHKVIETMGHNITKITPSRGFSVELGTATAVIIASFINLPVSTTHCAVGAIMAIGMVNDGWRAYVPRVFSCVRQGERRKSAVNWSLLSGIAASWVITLPVAGGISAALYAALRPVVLSVSVPLNNTLAIVIP